MTKPKLLAFFFLFISLYTFAEQPEKFKFEKVFPDLTFEQPLGFLIDPLNENISYVAGHMGQIWKVDSTSGKNTKELILDLSSRRGTKSEDGILDMIFHPDFKNNKKIILTYTNKDPLEDRVSSFVLTDKGFDLKSEKILLKIPQPYGNGNVGQIAIGPDGYLYVGVGDGGLGGDPDNNAQNLANLHGSLLRIDITKNEEGYEIPKDNPFVNTKDARPEIWAYGLRFPWRFSFDTKTGIMYCADVGQNKMEEVNIIEKGRNYGWRVKEGRLDFKDKEKEGIIYTMPIAQYGREDGLSIIGGYVYHGKIKELQGRYIYCDYITNNFWSLKYEDKKVSEPEHIGNFSLNVTSFFQDKNGELYVNSFRENNIFKLTKKE